MVATFCTAAGREQEHGAYCQALTQVRDEFPDVRLLVYGALSEIVFSALANDPGVVVVGKVTDAELAGLFKGAVAVVAASAEEGFGLATIEAFGFGTPVITSDRSPMREIAGGAAALVDPSSTADIAAALRLCLSIARMPSVCATWVGRATATSPRRSSPANTATSIVKPLPTKPGDPITDGLSPPRQNAAVHGAVGRGGHGGLSKRSAARGCRSWLSPCSRASCARRLWCCGPSCFAAGAPARSAAARIRRSADSVPEVAAGTLARGGHREPAHGLCARGARHCVGLAGVVGT